MSDWDSTDYLRRMEVALEVLKKDLSGLRAGRASAAFLDPVKVDAYGSLAPLAQVSTVSVHEPRSLVVQVWDRSLLKAVEKAINDSNLGLTPSIDGQNIRMSLPVPTEQRRLELKKLASKYAENAKNSVRSIRREAMDYLKQQEKESSISEDEQHRYGEETQKLTDDNIKKIDEILSNKQKEIMHV